MFCVKFFNNNFAFGAEKFIIRNMQKIEVGKTYVHYKGNKYKIIALAKHSETLEDMVVYQSLTQGGIWVRPMSMWNNVIDDKGTLRFTLID